MSEQDQQPKVTEVPLPTAAKLRKEFGEPQRDGFFGETGALTATITWMREFSGERCAMSAGGGDRCDLSSGFACPPCRARYIAEIAAHELAAGQKVLAVILALLEAKSYPADVRRLAELACTWFAVPEAVEVPAGEESDPPAAGGAA